LGARRSLQAKAFAESRIHSRLGDPRDCDNGFYAYAVPYYYVVPREREY
jgi:hypothetical protein